MGVIIFVIATITGIYVANYFRRSLLDLPNGRSNRISIDTNNIPSIKPEPIVVNSIIQAPILDRWSLSIGNRVLFNTFSLPEFRSKGLPNLALPTTSIEESGLFRGLVYGMMGLSTIGIDLVGGTHYGWVSISVKFKSQMYSIVR